ncbi:uncharacterized protein LOC132197512 isoform X2 [Neocloeon triangulifer]|uniref:uncharacterized protein LOC132197512 isoform X2 n=1 Tax=Neocloeon triangulifer TaxID=2078957 RepID=UPI00286F4E44|nr:uncharacterized protein LOC132197512 isoform X2 [Neocloeon triangulifer]
MKLLAFIYILCFLIQLCFTQDYPEEPAVGDDPPAPLADAPVDSPTPEGEGPPLPADDGGSEAGGEAPIADGPGGEVPGGGDQPESDDGVKTRDGVPVASPIAALGNAAPSGASSEPPQKSMEILKQPRKTFFKDYWKQKSTAKPKANKSRQKANIKNNKINPFSGLKNNKQIQVKHNQPKSKGGKPKNGQRKKTSTDDSNSRKNSTMV